jgi:hypothetical protein
MSYADYTRHRPEEATCRKCGWSGVAGDDCDCEEMDAEEDRLDTELDEGDGDE